MAITVSPDHLAARGISHTVATPTSSLMESSTATYGILDHLAELQPLLGDLVQPCAARIMGAIRQSPSPLTAIMRPMSAARYSLAKATSICRHIVSHLLPTSSRRDALLDDDASSATPQRQGAPQASHAFAATATAKPPPMLGGADARDDAKITLAVDSGSTWHLHPHRGQLSNLRPCNDSIKGIGGASQRCVEMGDLSFSALDENGGQVTVVLSDVRLAPNVDIALISASQLIGAGFEVILGAPPRLKDPFGTSLPLRTSNGLYLIDGQALASCSPHGKETPESGITHAAAFGRARDPHATSHISSLPPDEAARHMCRRLHLGVGRMRNLPSITADAPSNLSKARASTSQFMITANATKRAHT